MGKMLIPDLRKRFSVLLAICGIVLVLTYGLAAYLLYKRHGAVQPSADTAQSTMSEGDLIASAARSLKRGQVEQALMAYREALAKNPRSLRAQMGVAEGEFQAGREEVAAREYERALALDPGNKTALLQAAHIYSHERKTWPQSESKYREYLRAVPGDPQATLGLARVLAWQGKASEAAPLFAREDIRKLMTPDDEKDYAFALVKLGRDNEAEPLLKHLLGSRPQDTELSLQLAGIYASRKDWSSSTAIYRSLLARKPGDPRLNLNYGLELMAMNDYAEALQPLARATSAMPSNAEAGLAYARDLKETGNLKAAVKQYGKVAPRFGSNPAVLREYADTLMEKHDYRKSAEFYTDAYHLGLRDDRLLMGLAGALSGAGKDRQALPYLQELYRRDPTPRVTFELAKVLARLGKYDEARKLLRQVEASRGRGSARS